MGLEDAFEAAITLVEWPDRLGVTRPTRHLDLTFSMPNIETDVRVLNIALIGSGWDWIAEIVEDA